MLSFYVFMMRYTRDKNAVGALARYLERQEDFPRSTSYNDNLEQLQINGASSFLIETFERVYDGAYTDYMKNQRRVSESMDLRNEIYERTDCKHDNGEARSQYRQRPELALLALIAKGLFEIADAIKETNKTLHR